VASAVPATDEWRAAFLPFTAVLLALVVIFHFWSCEPYVVSRPRFDLIETVVRLLDSPTVRQMLVVGALFGIAWQGVITFLPTFLQAEKAVPPTLASNLFALLFLVGIGANLLGGRLADRFEVPYVIAGVAGVATVGLITVILARTTPIVIVGIVVLGVGLAAVWPVLQSYMMAQFPDSLKGGDYGAFSAGYVGIASAGPGIVGFVAERAGYAVAFGGLSCCLLLSTVLALRLARL
jgi:predicted MFS family arabinose efflux permease